MKTMTKSFVAGFAFLIYVLQVDIPYAAADGGENHCDTGNGWSRMHTYFDFLSKKRALKRLFISLLLLEPNNAFKFVLQIVRTIASSMFDLILGDPI